MQSPLVPPIEIKPLPEEFTELQDRTQTYKPEHGAIVHNPGCYSGHKHREDQNQGNKCGKPHLYVADTVQKAEHPLPEGYQTPRQLGIETEFYVQDGAGPTKLLGQVSTPIHGSQAFGKDFRDVHSSPAAGSIK
jgi:hypothetical protein